MSFCHRVEVLKLKILKIFWIGCCKSFLVKKDYYQWWYRWQLSIKYLRLSRLYFSRFSDPWYFWFLYTFITYLHLNEWNILMVLTLYQCLIPACHWSIGIFLQNLVNIYWTPINTTLNSFARRKGWPNVLTVFEECWRFYGEIGIWIELSG